MRYTLTCLRGETYRTRPVCRLRSGPRHKACACACLGDNLRQENTVYEGGAAEERAGRGLGRTEGRRRTHVHHDGGVGLGDYPTGDELASAREEVDLGVDELLELHDAQAHLGAARK